MNPDKLQKENKALGILNTIAQNLNKELELDLALQNTLVATVDLLDLKTAWIWLFEDSVQLAATVNLPVGLKNNPAFSEGSCYCLDVYHKSSATNINEITCSRLKSLSEEAEGLRYHASVPLFAKTEKIGVLNVVSPNLQKLSKDNLQILYTIGDMLSIAIERARLFAKSKQQGILEERNRLAREIHDTLAQGLSALSLNLETIEALAESNNGDKKLFAQIQKAKKITRESLEEARRSVLDLSAGPLQEHGLLDALEILLNESCTSAQIEYDLTIIGNLIPLGVRKETGIYRIVQEALNNALKHAIANYILVELTTEENQIKLIIQDDGNGFDPQNIQAGSFGLNSIAERAKLLRASHQIQSTPGEGTRIEIKIPI